MKVKNNSLPYLSGISGCLGVLMIRKIEKDDFFKKYKINAYSLINLHKYCLLSINTCNSI